MSAAVVLRKTYATSTWCGVSVSSSLSIAIPSDFLNVSVPPASTASLSLARAARSGAAMISATNINDPARIRAVIVQSAAATKERDMSKGLEIVVGCVAIALGCSGASSKSGGLTADARSFCMAIIDATANHQYACQGGSREAVNAQVRALDFCNGVSTVIGASHVTFDADVAAACL